MTITDTALDAHLRRWATAPAGDAATLARIISQASATAERSRSRPMFWAAGGGLAAAALAGVLIMGRPPATPAPAPAAAPPASAEASFRALHTPTPDEEQFL